MPPSQVRLKSDWDESGQTRFVKHITCPHCWQRFPLDELVWVAGHEELRGDPVLGKDGMGAGTKVQDVLV